MAAGRRLGGVHLGKPVLAVRRSPIAVPSFDQPQPRQRPAATLHDRKLGWAMSGFRVAAVAAIQWLLYATLTGYPHGDQEVRDR